jgi:hypothetical protein
MLWQMEDTHKLAVERILSLPANPEDWIEILKSSTFRAVPEILKTAIMSLHHLGPVQKIVLAKECNIHEWLLTGYRDLVERRETISVEDERQLGRKVTIILLRLRDQRCLLDHHSGAYHSNRFDIDRSIRTAFEKELEDAGF